MYIRDRVTKNRTGLRLATGVLIVILTLSAPFFGLSGSAFAAQREAEQQMPTGGITEPVIERIVSVISDGSNGNAENDTDNSRTTLKSIRPELRQYDWDCYSSDYYYSKLSAKERQLYEQMDAVCGKMLTSETIAASIYKVESGGKTVESRGTELVSCLGLSEEQVKKVRTIFVYANPQYYFLNTNLLLTNSGKACALGVYDIFVSGSKRAQETKKIRARLEELQAKVMVDDCMYVTEAQIHDLICDELVYLNGSNVTSDSTDPFYTQTVYGALINGETVCAGYTKLYEMLCNYFGIDCITVTSDDHAWNEVRYGDHWYIVDVTWDDTWDRSKYYHITDQRMRAVDQNNSHVPHAHYNGIRPVADVDFSGNLMLLPGLSQPNVEVRDTASGVQITMDAQAGEIYFTLDGTTPGIEDRYTGPMELNRGGTYMVTAMTAGDGCISSAYVIFPVRIAGGSVSVSALSNLSGRKLKVTAKASKNYTGYEFGYASKKDFSDQKTARGKGKAATISGLKKGKTYYVRVRGYKVDAYGNYYYTPYSKVKKITVKK